MADEEEHKPGGESSEGQKARKVAQTAPRDARSVTGLIRFFRSYGRALTATAGVLGGVFYVLLTWAASWVYKPAGVRPSQVGLGYGSLLVGTAVTLVTALAVVLIGVGVVFVAMWLRAKSLVGYLVAWVAVLAFCLAAIWLGSDVGFFLALVLPMALLFAYFFPEYAFRLVAGVGLVLVLAIASIIVLNNARLARDDIDDVSSGAFLDPFNPWLGRIAHVRTSTTDTCGLYLGEADGIGVLVVDGGEGLDKLITMRFPLSSVTLEIHPGVATC